MPALHPAPRSPIQSPLISQPRPSPYLRGVNFRAATGSRLVDIPAHSSDKPLPLSCIFTRPCCRLIHQQEIYTCMLDTHLRLYLLRCAAFHSVFFFSLSFFSNRLFSFAHETATFRTAVFSRFFLSRFLSLSSPGRIDLISTINFKLLILYLEIFHLRRKFSQTRRIYFYLKEEGVCDLARNLKGRAFRQFRKERLAWNFRSNCCIDRYKYTNINCQTLNFVVSIINITRDRFQQNSCPLIGHYFLIILTTVLFIKFVFGRKFVAQCLSYMIIQTKIII